MGRFINADAFVSTGQGILGNNMFAYCGNEPVIRVDPMGMWTFGISISFNITLFFTASISIGFFVDGSGNTDFQWSYSVPFVNNTVMIGVLDAGLGLVFQYTNRDTVYDLYGPCSVAGANGGSVWNVGADVISFSEPSSSTGSIDGIQFAVGGGLGVDVHYGTTNTKHVGRTNNTSSNQGTYFRERREYAWVM